MAEEKFLSDFEKDENGNKLSKAEILKRKSEYITKHGKDGYTKFEQIVRNSSKK